MGGQKSCWRALFVFLLGVQVTGLATLLVAIASMRLQADHLVAVVFLGELTEGRLNNTSLQVKYQVQVDSGRQA